MHLADAQVLPAAAVAAGTTAPGASQPEETVTVAWATCTFNLTAKAFRNATADLPVLHTATETLAPGTQQPCPACGAALVLHQPPPPLAHLPQVPCWAACPTAPAASGVG